MEHDKVEEQLAAAKHHFKLLTCRARNMDRESVLQQRSTGQRRSVVQRNKVPPQSLSHLLPDYPPPPPRIQAQQHSPSSMPAPAQLQKQDAEMQQAADAAAKKQLEQQQAVPQRAVRRGTTRMPSVPRGSAQITGNMALVRMGTHADYSTQARKAGDGPYRSFVLHGNKTACAIHLDA